jgi:polysaccharide biosynthesis protein PslA
MADLGIATTATAVARAPRHGIDAPDDRSAGHVGISEGDAAVVEIGIVKPSSGAVIEFDPAQIRGRPGERTRAAGRKRVNPGSVALWLRIADATVIGATGALAYTMQPTLSWPIDPAAAFAVLAVVAMLLRLPNTEPWLPGAVDRRSLSRRMAETGLRTLLPFFLCAVVLVALVPAEDSLRSPLIHWLTLWAMGAVFGVGAVRLGLSGMVTRWRHLGHLRQTIAIFGTGEIAERLLDRLQRLPDDSVDLVGLFDDRARRRIASPGLRSLTIGSADDLIALSRQRDIDRVLVALPHSAEHRVAEILKKLRRMPVEISLAPDLAGYNLTSADPDGLAGLPLVAVYSRPLTYGQRVLKSTVDKVVALTALIVGAPFLLAVALAIKLDSRGPVLFRQNRYGFGDRKIGVYKFRTMAADIADFDGTCQSCPNDPRITRIGEFLRRWSIDELPQLLNVVRGEMSLVGPRPHAVSMRVEERLNHDIVPEYAVRHHVKPGITGWAQVNGYHGPVATEEQLRARLRYDLEYIDNWSLWLDLQIVLRTLKIVLGRRQAY